MSMVLSGVSQAYPGFQLRDVSFEVSPGEIVGFLGPNGSGKSTTLRILLGLERPARGSALIDHRPYAQLSHPMRTVGSILDAQWIAGSQTVTHYLTWLSIAGGLDRSRIPDLLDQVDLAHAARKRVSRLSLGMRQRLGLAGALLGDPRYLVLDEPLNGLDPEGIRWFRDLLRTLRDQGRGILLSSHILPEVSAVADRVVMISDGRVTGAGTLDEFKSKGSLEDAFFSHLTPRDPQTPQSLQTPQSPQTPQGPQTSQGPKEK